MKWVKWYSLGKLFTFEEQHADFKENTHIIFVKFLNLQCEGDPYLHYVKYNVCHFQCLCNEGQ